ncbi:MAG: asparaginase [Candidatus Aegiribacteria sp.]|nr:asparaginase [Candidatus Aegiribacteria sp.]
MKNIAIVSTGGTIEMLPGHGGLDISYHHNPLPIQGNVIPPFVTIEHIRFCSVPSPSITPEIMAQLCLKLEEMTLSGRYHGIVVTHGTDTLEESAFLADIYLRSAIPVVFTAAMRSQSEMGVDGPRNLRGALLTASRHEVHKLGVTVVLNDEIHSASRVTKTYTSNVSSFKSPGYGPLGFVDQDRILLQRKPLWRIQLPECKLKLNQRVGLVRTAAGLGAREIRYCADCGDRALVVEALGRGNVPPEAAEAVQYAVEQGTIVCITSRCYIGRVLGVYNYPGGGADLERRGAILAGDMQGQKLRLLLMASLGIGLTMKNIRKLFERL